MSFSFLRVSSKSLSVLETFLVDIGFRDIPSTLTLLGICFLIGILVPPTAGGKGGLLPDIAEEEELPFFFFNL